MRTKNLQSVTFEQAKRLKAAGFDWHDCETTGLSQIAYMEVIQDNRPTVPLALKWMRDEKKIKCGIEYRKIEYVTKYCWWYSIDNGGIVTTFNVSGNYEVTESALLDKLLDLLLE